MERCAPVQVDDDDTWESETELEDDDISRTVDWRIFIRTVADAVPDIDLSSPYSRPPLRQYQEHVVDLAMEGHNVLVESPTGSGMFASCAGVTNTLLPAFSNVRTCSKVNVGC